MNRLMTNYCGQYAVAPNPACKPCHRRSGGRAWPDVTKNVAQKATSEDRRLGNLLFEMKVGASGFSFRPEP